MRKGLNVMSETCASNDLAAKKIAWLLWCVPSLVLVLGWFWSEARIWLWTPALLAAGVFCAVNAARCGRLHCYVTGPLYLLLAAVTLLRGLEVLSLRWSWILFAVVAGTVLAHIPEWLHDAATPGESDPPKANWLSCRYRRRSVNRSRIPFSPPPTPPDPQRRCGWSASR